MPFFSFTSLAKEYPRQYLCASAIAATVNYPLWRSAAIGQSGFRVVAHIGGRTVPAHWAPYVYGFLPPYKGMVATVFGMTWARAAIFWMSDTGRDVMLQQGYSEAAATVLPPLVTSTIVQVINQPIVRSTVTLQDPKYNVPNVFRSMQQIYQTHGISGLWHGTTAGVLKTVPKYIVAIAVKDWIEDMYQLPPNPNVNDPSSSSSYYQTARLQKSAIKSVAAGVAGAALTNPLDVVRNEQFKNDLGLRVTVQRLYQDMGWKFIVRGLGKNMMAVAMPIGCTIFLTDLFIQYDGGSSGSSSSGGG
jgi:hypothetical protein